MDTVYGDVGIDGGAITLMSGAAGTVFSAPLRPPAPFNAFHATWLADPEADGFAPAIRTSRDGVNWGAWQTLELEDERPSPDLFGTLLLFPSPKEPRDWVQCRFALLWNSGRPRPSMSDVALTFIDSSEGPSGDYLARLTASSALGAASWASKPPVISRTEWGCPDGQESPKWPPKYQKAYHVIVHHTATSNTASDWAAVVRAIWKWHALSSSQGGYWGWGDMGYNFVIDPNGVIYEGRAGANADGRVDDDVPAAHTSSFNTGSMGVAIIGDFRSYTPTDASLRSLERLIVWKALQRGFAPDMGGVIRRTCDGADVWAYRVSGHLDFAWDPKTVCTWLSSSNQTECPGTRLHGLLPAVRAAAAHLVAEENARAEISAVTISPPLVAVGAELNISVTIRNVSTTPLRGGSPSAGHVYTEGEQAGSAETGTFRIGVDYEGRDPAQGPYPYRWGFGQDLAPGESRTVSLRVKIGSEASRRYWVALIREGHGVMVDGVGQTLVHQRIRTGDVCLAGLTLTPAIVFTEGSLVLETEVQNWTGQTLATQGAAPGYVYDEGEVCEDDQYGCYRIGIDYEGNRGPRDYPYRWGFGDPMPPLSVRTVRGYVRFREPRPPRHFWAGLVQESVTWWQQGLATTEVRVERPVSRIVIPGITLGNR